MESVRLDTETIISRVLEQAATSPDIEVVWLYGSRAQGKEHEDSDVDLAIAFHDFSLSPFEKYLRPNTLTLDWAQSLDLPSDKLSIVDINQVPAYLGFSIVNEGRVIYGADCPRAYRESSRIYSMYEHQRREQQHEE